MSQRLPLLVFSDLDGTLLDHHDYSWDAAGPGLKRLQDIGAGLDLASSKTAAEIDGFRRDMGFSHMPAIVENGAGILWPNQPETSGASEYQNIRKILQQLPPGFLGVADMTAKEVSDRTGLAPVDAAKAQDRHFSEPGLWTGPPEDLDRFLAEAEHHGLHARRGGRFLTLSFGKTKADAMSEVIALLKPEITIALGDAPNDLEMILAADTGVIIANSHGVPIPVQTPDSERRIIRTTLEGPKGWADALLTLTAGQ
jgi:mannosyl-3-phosphoglycerate phosphatase